jgi:hypothetical protein
MRKRRCSGGGGMTTGGEPRPLLVCSKCKKPKDINGFHPSEWNRPRGGAQCVVCREEARRERGGGRKVPHGAGWRSSMQWVRSNRR